ncbi:MAG: glycosyltransferase family 4 protein [Hydrogenovibrio sp.]|uniref:glycosyltransferase family 4 protein n=1 Tax=Hydrogenovibrio sp. TaxID=2065821 RepID=UPI00286FFD4C|nr:glycosyltransferase family 4 protein [Hydrogenovibrio sp.]MDR9498530.1 glycosyltransferase family 4 protein [Hydrogenovibrio sp.]MDR9499240.1 glycosyltransferase family 4 protein [Hydrogenovibrio sp.]
MSKPTHKIAHLTSAHPRYDTRIFIKMCSSLAANGYYVSLVVADGQGDEVKNGVSIVDVGAKTGGRLSRMMKAVKRVFEKAKELDADIYHLHDPELIPAGIKLKKLGKKVIFDAHEDLPKQLLGKPYLNKPAKLMLSKVFEWYECWTCPKFDAMIAATPFIRDKFLKINPNTVDINNFPLLDELANTSDWTQKENEVAYVGGIAKIRGIEEVISALEYTNGVRLNLAGSFSEKAVEEEVKNHQAWSKVNELGFLNRQQVNEVLAKSRAGLVTLHPVINYIDALPVKMFEYMAAGIPVIASNFPLWRDIVQGNQCGLCVDPLNPKAIGEAIQYLIDHPLEAEKMGKNGSQAVEQKYNWKTEEQKLLDLYDRLP